MMKTIYNTIKYATFTLLTGFAMLSCDDYLDRAPELPLDDETVFTIFANAERYHNDIYGNLQSRFNAVGDYQPVPWFRLR